MTRHPIAALGLALLLLAGCTRLGEIGQDPEMSGIGDRADMPESRLVSLPMPPPTPVLQQKNSVWRMGATSFFGDQRASRVGDILTVLIDIRDEAKLRNDTQRQHQATEAAGLSHLFGLEFLFDDIFGSGVQADKLVGISTDSKTTGTGQVNRNEQIRLKLAAIITEVLPNGTLAIVGRQEIRVNSELRELRIAGVIRPQDITATNTIGYDHVAEARISYGGRGVITDVQRPRYGQEIYDLVMPF